MKEALYYKKNEGKAFCFLCPHHCVIAMGKTGLCQVRKNIEGTLYTLNYGIVSSINLDPIEKKPLYHVCPGATILSLGTFGCNLSCSFCQNWSISQLPPDRIEETLLRDGQVLAPVNVGHLAKKYTAKESIGIAYTYNEPSIWFEFVLESAKEVKKHGLKNILVTNGYLEQEPLEELLPYIDAVNVDIKSISDSFYKKLCGGRVDPVLNYCKTAKKRCLVEITNLIVTGENDSIEDIEKLTSFIADELGRDTPIHFSRYHPEFKWDSPPTSGETLEQAYNIALKKLDYVYVGNVWNPKWDATHCPQCKKKVIDRSGYNLHEVKINKQGRCLFCDSPIAVIME